VRGRIIAEKNEAAAAFTFPSSRWREDRIHQSLTLDFDHLVTFAGTSGECDGIDDLDMAPAVTNKVRLLEGVGHDRDAVAAGADHLCHQFLSQIESVAVGEVSCAQQPTRQTRLHGMHGIATRGLLSCADKAC
jgi:hypothetical protein